LAGWGADGGALCQISVELYHRRKV
jgi:hypothetical protein